MSATPVLSFDPLPPADSLDTYDVMAARARARGPTEADDPNVLRVFLRSLMPNWSPDNPRPQPGADG